MPMIPEHQPDVVAAEYLQLASLSVYAGLCVRTLRTYLSHPVHPLPCYKIGGRVLVRRSDYDAWAERFRNQSVSSVNTIVNEVMRGL